MGTRIDNDRTRRISARKDGTIFYRDGWVDPDTEKEFDTLIEKICEPAPWDYACFEVDS